MMNLDYLQSPLMDPHVKLTEFSLNRHTYSTTTVGNMTIQIAASE
jgi:hypothetical protein